MTNQSPTVKDYKTGNFGAGPISVGFHENSRSFSLLFSLSLFQPAIYSVVFLMRGQTTRFEENKTCLSVRPRVCLSVSLCVRMYHAVSAVELDDGEREEADK